MATPTFILPSAPTYTEGFVNGLNVYPNPTNFVANQVPFTRATTATRTNAAGLIELTPYNLLSRSEQFENVVWGKNTLTYNSLVTAPNGTLTALNYSTGGNFSYGLQVGTIIPNAYYTTSVYLKYTSGVGSILVRFSDGSSINFISVTANLINGTIGAISYQGNGANGSASIQSVGNGWYRVILSGTLNVASAGLIFTNGTLGATTFSVWGAQLVEGTAALPYQLTETRLNRPRVDFSLGGCPNLLLEPQRTNLALYSEQLDDASWTKLAATITANATASPSGIINADKIVESNTTASHGILRSVTTVASTYNVSFYAKAAERSCIQWNNQVTLEYVNFDLINGVVGSNSGVTNAEIKSVGNGWYRCSFNFVSTVVGTAGFIRLVIVTSATSARLENYLGNGTSGLFVWGAQFELGAYPTTYVPTTAATVTRNTDTFTLSNVFTNNMISSAGGTWFVDLRNNLGLSRDAFSSGLYLSDAGFLISFLLRNDGGPNSRLRLQKRVGGVETPLLTTSTNTCKIAIKWNGSTADVFENGIKVVAATSFTGTAMENLVGLAGDVPKIINSMALWNTPLTDDELEVITGTAFDTYALMASNYNYILQ
jgi:hypothetical protein